MKSIAEVAEGPSKDDKRKEGNNILRIPTSQIVDDRRNSGVLGADRSNCILTKEDLIWASLDADKYDKFYKKPPPFVPSMKIYREYLYSLGEVPFGEKKRQRSKLSPLLPKNLEDLSDRQRADVRHGASQRQFSPLKVKAQKDINPKTQSPTIQFVGRRYFPATSQASSHFVPREIRTEPIDWNQPEYVNTPNLFYRCSNPDAFFRGTLDRSSVSTLLKDRHIQHHGQYERVARQLSHTVKSGVKNMPGFQADSAYLPTGITRSEKNDPSHFLPDHSSSSNNESKQLELTILRNIASRERTITKLRENCHNSILSGDGTFATKTLIRNAKKALSGKALIRACDIIRQASLKVLLDIDKWRICLNELEKNTFYEMSLSDKEKHTNDITRQHESSATELFEIGMPITPNTPNTLDFSQWTSHHQLQRQRSLQAENNITPNEISTPSTTTKSVYSRIHMPARPFFYKGENYTARMKRDMSFMDDMLVKNGRSITEYLQICPTYLNPLLFPATLKEMAGNASILKIKNSQVPLNQSQYRGLNMLELREAASILIDDFRHWDEVSYLEHLEDVDEEPQTKVKAPLQDEPFNGSLDKSLGYDEEARPGVTRLQAKDEGAVNSEGKRSPYVVRLVECGTQTVEGH